MRTARAMLATVAVLALVTAACGGGATTVEPVIETVSPERASEIVDGVDGVVVLDIRTPEEFAQARLAGAVNIDFYADDFEDRLAELDRGTDYVLYCRTGNRTSVAREIMRQLGFESVHEIDGGIVNWYETGLPIEQ
jgi:rhodanese-related sulfurtransferase